jgi:hypothetical protein
MTLIDRPRSWEDHQWRRTSHECICGAFMWRCSGSTFHKCPDCGSEGYEVPVQ